MKLARETSSTRRGERALSSSAGTVGKAGSAEGQPCDHSGQVAKMASSGSAVNPGEPRPDEEQALTDVDALLRDCLDRKISATGTAVVLEDRAARLSSRLKLLSFLGLAVPVIVGGLVLSYGAGFEALGVIIGVGAGLSLVQLIVSVWAMTANWVDAQERALRSAIRNRELARSFDRVSLELLSDPVGTRRDYDRLVGRDDSQQDNDYALGFTKAETRAAHRAGLRQHRAPCSACKQVPTDMTASDCGVCGDFVWKRTRGFVDRRRTHPDRPIAARS